MNRTLPLTLIMLILLLGACQRRTEVKPPAPKPPEISDLTAEANHWADSVAGTLTLRQKVAQLFLPAVFASDDYWTLRLVREYADSCIGGVVLLKGDSVGARHLADTMSRGAVAPFVAIDAEWGLAMRLADAPKFPANGNISDGADEQLMYDYGNELARECRLLGINMVLGPVVDVASENSFLRRRSFGSDPVRVADLALAYARGLEDGDVISVAKHFPGHGSVSTDSHRRKGVIDRSLNQMDSIDLYPFRKWVEQRLTGVMVGHLAVPSIDSRMLPAAVSRTVISDLLRDDLGFRGLVLTDAINMAGAEGYSSADALAAGADIIVAPAKTFREIDAVVRAIADSTATASGAPLTASDIDGKARRVLFHKYLLGLYETPEASHSGRLHTKTADTLSSKLSAGL